MWLHQRSTAHLLQMHRLLVCNSKEDQIPILRCSPSLVNLAPGCMHQKGRQGGGTVTVPGAGRQPGGRPSPGISKRLRDSQSCRESWFLLNLSSQLEMGATSSPFPCHRYVHDPEALCRWQPISSTLLPELCPRLGLTSIAVSSLRVALRNEASSCC